MLLTFFALLGVAASQALRLPGLLLTVSLLAVAIGAKGALSHHAFASVLEDVMLMLVVVEGAFASALVLGSRKDWLLSHWKI